MSVSVNPNISIKCSRMQCTYCKSEMEEIFKPIKVKFLVSYCIPCKLIQLSTWLQFLILFRVKMNKAYNFKVIYCYSPSNMYDLPSRNIWRELWKSADNRAEWVPDLILSFSPSLLFFFPTSFWSGLSAKENQYMCEYYHTWIYTIQ